MHNVSNGLHENCSVATSEVITPPVALSIDLTRGDKDSELLTITISQSASNLTGDSEVIETGISVGLVVSELSVTVDGCSWKLRRIPLICGRKECESDRAGLLPQFQTGHNNGELN